MHQKKKKLALWTVSRVKQRCKVASQCGYFAILSYAVPPVPKLAKLVLYSQNCELRPPKGLGISGPISQVVPFARLKNFQNGVVHMALREPLTSAIGSSHVYSGATTMKAELPTRSSLFRSACERKSDG